MAITLRYSDALSVVSKRYPKALEDNFAAIACNIYAAEAWMKYDFRTTLKTLPPFYLIPNEQDHGAPSTIVPSDFLGLRETYFTRLAGNPGAPNQQVTLVRTPINVVKDLGLTEIRGIPRDICYQPSAASSSGSGTFRIFPRVPINFGSPQYMIEGTYKFRPTKITAATLDTLLPFDDMFFQGAVAGLSWAMSFLTQDAKATFDAYSVFAQELEKQASNEGLELGDNAIHPEEPLVGSRMQNIDSVFNNFGW